MYLYLLNNTKYPKYIPDISCRKYLPVRYALHAICPYIIYNIKTLHLLCNFGTCHAVNKIEKMMDMSTKNYGQ